MAHFAKLNENNEVIKVIVVGEEEVSHNGDPAGEAYCTKLFGGTWKQTSYNTRRGFIIIQMELYQRINQKLLDGTMQV